MAFPFLYLLLSLSAGIFFFSKILHLPGIFLVIIFIISLLSSWLFYCLERLKISYFLILLSVFFLGAFLQISSDKNFQNNALHNLDYSSYADIYGTLYKSPRKSHNKVYLYMKVHKINYQKKEITAKGNLRITVFNSSPENNNLDLFINDRIKASAQFVSHKGFFNFGQSSLDLYLKTNKIHKRAFTKSPLLIEKLKKASTFNFLNFISRIRNKIQKRIEQYFHSPAENALSPEGAVLEALMLGERQRLDPEFSRSLQQTGLYHLLAISGAHIAIISFFLFSLFKMLRMSNSLSYTLIIAFLMFNAFLVEGRPSVIRATIMAVAFLIGKLIFSDVNLMNTISISAFFLLVINPFFLFNSGFLLTFTATFSIILFFPKIMKYLPKIKFRISEIFGISLCAQLGVIPIIIIFFNRAAFSSIVYNYIALPLVALIMASGYIFLPISLTIPFLARISSKIIYFLINLLIKFTSLSANASLSLCVPNPHLMVIIGYYVFLLLFLFPTKIKKQKLILFLCFLVMFTFLILHPFPKKSKNLKVTMIDVGQGDSILIELPGREKMLIDGGGVPNDNFDIGEFAVSKFLWKKRIKKIDYLILSHAHPDHINGLKSIARNFKIGEFWEAYTPVKNNDYTEFRRHLPDSVNHKNLFRGEIYKKDDIIIEILHPERKKIYVSTVYNDHSLVFRLSYGKISFLFTGDISSDAEKEILKNTKHISSQILKSPHHGSKTSSSMVFLKEVNPKIAIISVGRNNQYHFPNKQVLKRYDKIKARVFRTDLHGAIEIKTDGHTITIRKTL